MQVIQDKVFYLVRSRALLAKPAAEIEVGSACEVCQPSTEADDEPSGQIEWFEKDYFDLFEGGADGVDNTYSVFLWCYSISPPR